MSDQYTAEILNFELDQLTEMENAIGGSKFDRQTLKSEKSLEYYLKLF